MHRSTKQLVFAALVAALATPAAAQELKPQTLKMANVVPENSWFGRQHKWWVSEVEKRTGNQISLLRSHKTLPKSSEGHGRSCIANVGSLYGK